MRPPTRRRSVPGVTAGAHLRLPGLRRRLGAPRSPRRLPTIARRARSPLRASSGTCAALRCGELALVRCRSDRRSALDNAAAMRCPACRWCRITVCPSCPPFALVGTKWVHAQHSGRAMGVYGLCGIVRKTAAGRQIWTFPHGYVDCRTVVSLIPPISTIPTLGFRWKPGDSLVSDVLWSGAE